MSTFPGSPKLVKGGIVIADPDTLKINRVIALQYNPDTLTRSLQPKSAGTDTSDRSEPLRLSGPPVETFRVEAEIDATDQLEIADSVAVKVGIQPQLAALELLIYPTVAQLKSTLGLANSGTMEIAPMEAPLTLFIWSKNRIIPVRITEFSITEEAFDPSLNPIRARISLGMRVLSTDDFDAGHKGSSLYLSYQQKKEQLSSQYKKVILNQLGIDTIS